MFLVIPERFKSSDPNPPPKPVSKIIVYEHGNFQGRSKEFTSNVADLSKEQFNDTISSLKVIGNPWMAYPDCNFKGDQCIFEEGEYPALEMNDSISSLELVKGDLTNPQITLYEKANFGGRSVVLTSETYLDDVSFNDTACSHKVQKGMWVLYEHGNRGGAKMFANAGEAFADYEWWSKRVSSARPLKAGK